MKTLADLKRRTADFEWSNIYNSWFKEIPDFLREFRKVATVQTNSFSLKTIRNGEEIESWSDYPKAKELTIEKLDNGYYQVIIKRDITRDCDETQQFHTMIYQLREVNHD